jgi:hypothetical protein
MTRASNQENRGFSGVLPTSAHGSAGDPVITNNDNAEGTPKENPAASWVFLVADSRPHKGIP